MKNILYDLYCGNINPQELRSAHASEYKALNRKIEDEKRYFVQKMSMDDCERFQKLENLYVEANDFERFNSFSHGFKLALMLACECFS